MRSEIVAEHVPLLAAALPHVAHPAIRNRGTIGGSMALADPAAELPAVALALGAVITLRNAAGARRVPADDFFLGMYETALEAGELVTEVDFPEAADGDRFAFHELAQRHGDYAMAGVAVAAKGPDALSEVRVAFFGVAERALRVSGAEAALAGRRADDPAALADAVAALDAIDFAADPATGAATRRHLAGVVLRRALGEI